MQEALVVRRETHIPAPPAAVFALLTDPEKILRWMGTEAQVEPQPLRSASMFEVSILATPQRRWRVRCPRRVILRQRTPWELELSRRSMPK